MVSRKAYAPKWYDYIKNEYYFDFISLKQVLTISYTVSIYLDKKFLHK